MTEATIQIKEYSLCTWCGDKYESSLWTIHQCTEDKGE